MSVSHGLVKPRTAGIVLHGTKKVRPVFSGWRMPERTGGDPDLKPCAFPNLSIFPDVNTGYRQDLTNEEKTKAGISAKTSPKDLLFVLRGDTGTVICTGHQEMTVFFAHQEPDFRGRSCILQGVVKEIEEYFFKQGIGEYLNF